MFRYSRNIALLSSQVLHSKLLIVPFFNFFTCKSAKCLATSKFINNNLFMFAELPKHQVLTMPALSPTMTEGKIVKWNVKEGDKIDVGDVICDIQTDKATIAFQSTDKGFIAKVLNSNQMLGVGKPVAILAKKSDDVLAFKLYQFGEIPNQQQNQQQKSTEQKPQKQQHPPKTTPVSKSYPPHGLLKLPAVSPTMTEGKIVQWKIKEGDLFDVGDSLFSIQTDKATMDYEATQKGVLARILNDGSKALAVGVPVAVWTKKKEDIGKFKDFTGDAPTSIAPAPAQTKSAVQYSPSLSQANTKTSSNTTIFASPLAKTLAQQRGINLFQLQGSGPHGRILKQDIDSYQPKDLQKLVQTTKSSKETPSKQNIKKPRKIQIPQNSFQQIPINSMRKTIASRLTESKTTIPHYYIQVAVEMNKILELRTKLNKQIEKQGIKISVNDMIVKAVALALRDVPDANTQWHGSVIKKFKHSDVSVAVATEGGLITPIVFRAETLGLIDIAKKTKDIAKRARQGKLDPSEFIGGTTTVSNLGMFGIDSVTSVINPPQSTILGVGQTNKKVVFDTESSDQKAPYKVVDSMELIVSADHRVVDGALAAKWLSRVKKYLQEPITMLL